MAPSENPQSANDHKLPKLLIAIKLAALYNAGMAEKALDIKKVLQDSFGLYKKYLFVTILFSVAMAVVSEGERFLFQKNQIDILGVSVLTSYIAFLINIFLLCVLTIYIHKRENRKEYSIQNALAETSNRFTAIAISVTLFMVGFLAGTLALVIPGIILFVIFGQFFYFALLEKASVFDSLRASRKLTAGNRIKIFYTFFIVLIPYFFIALVLGERAFFGYGQTIFSIFPGSFINIFPYVLWRELRVAK